MRYLGLVLKSLLRSKRRTILVVLSITLATLLVALLQSMLTTLDNASNNPNSSNRIVVRHKSGLTQMLPLRYLPYLKAQPEVEEVTYMQWFGGTYKDPRDFFANFASDQETLFKVFKEEFSSSGVSEAQLQDFYRDGNGCIVGESLAKKFGWKVGDTIPLQGTIFPINPRLNVRLIFKGRRPSEENVLHFHYKLLEEGVPRMKGLVGTFFLRVKRPDDIPRLIERIDRQFANSQYETLSETENAFNLSFVKMLGNISQMLNVITVAVLLAILMVTANTMGMAVRERTTEIAVLRALGFRGATVLALLLCEGLVLVGLGAALGVGLSVLLAGGVRATVGSVMPFLADFAVEPSTILLCLGAAGAVGFLATFVPAYQAVRRPITQGLRSL